MEGILVVAVCTKKDYMAVPLQENPLTDSCWVQLHNNNHNNLYLYSTILKKCYKLLNRASKSRSHSNKHSKTVF